jgi:hypothetical protein
LGPPKCGIARPKNTGDEIAGATKKNNVGPEADVADCQARLRK